METFGRGQSAMECAKPNVACRVKHWLSPEACPFGGRGEEQRGPSGDRRSRKTETAQRVRRAQRAQKRTKNGQQLRSIQCTKDARVITMGVGWRQAEVGEERLEEDPAVDYRIHKTFNHPRVCLWAIARESRAEATKGRIKNVQVGHSHLGPGVFYQLTMRKKQIIQ